MTVEKGNETVVHDLAEAVRAHDERALHALFDDASGTLPSLAISFRYL